MILSAITTGIMIALQPTGCGQPVLLGEISAQPTDLRVVGDLAYTVEGRKGLVITNIGQDPLNPIAQFETDLIATRIMISDDVAVLSRGYHQPALLDLTDPLHPLPAATIPETLGLHTDTIWLDGDMLLTNPDSQSISLYDVSDPYQPEKVSEIRASGDDLLNGCVIEGNYLYAISSQRPSRFTLIFDISDPSSPTQISAFELGTYSYDARRLVVRDGLLLVLASFNNIATVLDVTDPTAPRRIETQEPLYNLNTAAVAPGGAVAVAYQGDRLHLLYRSDGKALEVRSFDWKLGEPRFSFGHSDDTVYISTSLGIMSMDISEPTEPMLNWVRPSLRFPRALHSFGSTLLVTTQLGMVTLDTSEPELIRVIGVPLRTEPNTDAKIIVDPSRSIAFEIGPRIYAVDITNPASLTDLSWTDGLDGVYAHARSGTTLFLSGYGGPRDNLAIVTTDPYKIYDDVAISPSYVWHPNSFHTEDSIFYADAQDLRVFDTSTLPQTPAVGYFNLDNNEMLVAVHDRFVYTTLHGELRTLDASNLTDIQRIPYVQPGSVAGHDFSIIRGDKLYLYHEYAGIYVYDITQPSRPVLVTTLDTTALINAERVSVTDFDIEGEFLYLTVSARPPTDNPGGVLVARLPNCAVPCPTDLALPDGELDAADLSAFISLLLSGRDRAEWNQDGEINFFDLVGFIKDLSLSCP